MSRPISRTTRYVYKNVPISQQEALEERARKLSYLNAKLREAQESIICFQNAPLPTTRLALIALKLGDEGYDEAPEGFNGLNNQGNFTWVNIENSTPSTPE